MSSAPHGSSTTIDFSCHCGAIKVAVPRDPAPEYMNECMCSICRRYAAAWIYYSMHKVRIEKAGPTKMYCWGDKTCEFTWCEQCGCLMYWCPARGEVDQDTAAAGEEKKMGVNSRCVDRLEDLKFVDRRITWGEALVRKEGVYDEHGPSRS